MLDMTILRTCAAMLLFSVRVVGMAQSDTSSIGGPEDITPYEETGSGPDIDEAPSPELMTAADSASIIPGYATYGSWNTDVIFPYRPAVTDTLDLCLSWSDCDHTMPICGRITSPFGIRHGHHHYGTDLKLQVGDPVMCAFPGMVRISRYHREFGNVIVVRHANGLETLYAHLSKRNVEEGDIVEAGEVIGLGGSTGRSTGSHLHFETRYLGHPIDPQRIFDVEKGVLRSDSLLVEPELFATTVSGNSLALPKTYTVRRGDTLYGISRRAGVSVKGLCRMNRISVNRALRIGQRLRIH
jgi:murein DD-endopeptidase MepM/ murein hydrolase activator NlpD